MAYNLPPELPLSGGTLTGVLNLGTSSGLNFDTNFYNTGTLHQTGTSCVFSAGASSAFDGAWVVPATGNPFRVYYQGTSTMLTDISQTISAGTAFSLYYSFDGADITQSQPVARTFFNYLENANLPLVNFGNNAIGMFNFSGSGLFTNGVISAQAIGFERITGTSGVAASQNTTTVTTNSTFSASNVGQMILWSTGQVAFIKAYIDSTHVTVVPSQTVALAQYVLTSTSATAIDAQGNIGTNNAYIYGSLNMPDGSTLITAGGHSTTLTTTNTTNVTLPASGTLATTSQLPTAAALTAGNDTNITLTLAGTPATALLQAASITAGWSGELSLARGGTNAALTASNGGILYSTASAFAILAGTATAGQMLLSGSSTTPAWSTTTYPSTNAISTLLYASAANVMSALATGNNGILITSGTGVPSISSTLPSAVQSNITAVNSGANTLTIGGSVKTFLSGAVNIASSVDPTTYSPVVAFGGNSVGLTYTTQTGFYRQLKYVNGTTEVQIWGTVIINAIGSSTGVMTFTLPIAAGTNGGNYIIQIAPVSITAVGATVFFGQVQASTSTARIDVSASASAFSSLQNTNFASGSGFVFSGSYLTN